MALGFGFNKTKVLASAEKNVQQGKLANAISEYLKVLKEDPKDLTIQNTVGDLHARLGQNEQAVTCFKKVGDTYAHDGFTVKAIAMYKKITKITPGDPEVVQRLAELYTQQGLYNDARAQYMQLADAHVRGSRLDEASKVFQKMLELDPENATVQAKLADLYLRLGKAEDAKNIYLTAAQSLYLRGSFDASDDALGKILKIDPSNATALQMRGQVAVEAGKAEQGVTYLESIADLDSRPDALQSLLKGKMALGKMDEAEPIARKLLTVHNNISGATIYADGLMAAGQYEAALRVYDENAERLLSTNTTQIMAALNGCITKIQDNPAALELLYSVMQRVGDTSHMGETMELLAHALAHAERFSEARDLYKELANLEPENPIHNQNYRQMLAKLGEDATVRPLTEQEKASAALATELDLPAPTLVQEYSGPVEDAIKAALTDSELNESYNIEGKAIPPLEAVLKQAPSDVRLNHRLTALYARAGRHADAARCAQTIHDVSRAGGKREDAEAYAKIAEKFRAAAGIPAPPASEAAAAEFVIDASAPAAMQEFSFADVSAPAAEPEPPAPLPTPPKSVEAAPPPPPKPVAHEIDISNEWEVEVSGEAPAGSIGEILDEARFYLSQGMVGEATAALDRAAAIAPNDPEVAKLRAQAAGETAVLPPAPAPIVAEFGFDASGSIEAAPPAEDVAQFEAPAAVPAEPPSFEMPIETASAIEPPPLIEEPPAVEEHFEPPQPPPAIPEAPAEPVVAAKSGKGLLDDFALDLADSLPEDFGAPAGAAATPAAKMTPPPPAPAAAPAAAAAAAPAPAASSDIKNALSDIFDDFKEGVEAGQPEEEDPNTHYNLGVAFKEMALLDEAIGEFQKVCHAMEAGVPFAEPVQVYTLLAGCFAEKGVPQASTKWLLKALSLPNIDEDTKLALHYEIGSVSESAGDKNTALKHFMEVYGTNIDYRDVAERIKALRA